MELEQGDTLLCTVDKITGTIVFVKILFQGKELEGSIVTSEIAPGRIRNLRDYVVPKKKIVCKVLRIRNGNIELSLRRVTPKETKEVVDQYKQENSYLSVLKSVLKDKTDVLVKEIEKEQRLFDFIEEIKENPKKLESLIGKSEAKKIMDILLSQKQKKINLRKRIIFKTNSPNGIEIIRDILGKVTEAKIKYLSAGNYSISTEADNIKRADQKIQEIVKIIEKEAQKNNSTFVIS